MILALPVVKRLRAKNKSLKKMNKKLVQLLISKLTKDKTPAPTDPVPNVRYELFEVVNESLEPREELEEEEEELEEELEEEEEELEEEEEEQEEEQEEEELEEEEQEEEELEEQEEEEEQEEQEEEELEEQEEEEQEELEEEEEEEEALEVFSVQIRGKRYFATNTTNGDIYAMDSDGEVGDKVGQFVQGEARLS